MHLTGKVYELQLVKAKKVKELEDLSTLIWNSNKTYSGMEKSSLMQTRHLLVAELDSLTDRIQSLIEEIEQYDGC